MVEIIPFWLIPIFFVIALFYSMVGFGGGSSYLAVLVLAGLPYQQIPPVALVCNLIVAGGGFWHFYKGGHFEREKLFPLIILSIPMAFWGGSIRIGKELFSFLLGLSLLAAALRMAFPERLFDNPRTLSWKETWSLGLPIGGLLGFLSGLVGIGGGVFLSPLLLFMGWVNVKQASAFASFFILVNSLSGLMGQFQKGLGMAHFLLPLGIAVFIGGQIGSMLGSYHISKLKLQRLLATLLLLVSAKLLWRGF